MVILLWYAKEVDGKGIYYCASTVVRTGGGSSTKTIEFAEKVEIW